MTLDELIRRLNAITVGLNDGFERHRDGDPMGAPDAALEAVKALVFLVEELKAAARSGRERW